MKMIFAFLGSFGLACVLLVNLFLLTLFGTFEQVDHGLFEVQKRYFESWYVVHRLWGVLPLPLLGGALAMGLLAVNLLVGGLVRIQKSWRTAGVLVIHVGIALLLAASLVKMTMSDDGYLRLYEGESSEEFVSYYLWEVAVWEADQRGEVRERLVPGDLFKDLDGDRTRTFTSPELPFELELAHFRKNCRPLPKGPMWDSGTPVVDGWALRTLDPALEAEQNIAGVYATVRDAATGAEEQGILWGAERYPFTFEAGGRTWAATLRHRRYTMPFALRLVDFTKEEHPRMRMAKSYMSDVVKVEDGNEQPVRIQMNEPLRHGGLVLFQASWGPENARPGEPLFSVFSVVRNPSDHWPLYSCIVIGVGLLLAFGAKLVRYVRSQTLARRKAEGAPQGKAARRARRGTEVAA